MNNMAFCVVNLSNRPEVRAIRGTVKFHCSVIKERAGLASLWLVKCFRGKVFSPYEVKKVTLMNAIKKRGPSCSSGGSIFPGVQLCSRSHLGSSWLIRHHVFVSVLY